MLAGLKPFAIPHPIIFIIACVLEMFRDNYWLAIYAAIKINYE